MSTNWQQRSPPPALAPDGAAGSVSAGSGVPSCSRSRTGIGAHAQPLLLAATASYIGEGFDCPALTRCSCAHRPPLESIITQNVGRIMRDLPGKTTAEVHDYADTGVPMLTRMHGRRLTAYKKIGFAFPVVGETPLSPGGEMAGPDPRCPHPRPPGRGSPAEWPPSRPPRSGHGRRNTPSTSPTAAGYAPKSGSSTTPPIWHDRQVLRKEEPLLVIPAWVCVPVTTP